MQDWLSWESLGKLLKTFLLFYVKECFLKYNPCQIWSLSHSRGLIRESNSMQRGNFCPLLLNVTVYRACHFIHVQVHISLKLVFVNVLSSTAFGFFQLRSIYRAMQFYVQIVSIYVFSLFLIDDYLVFAHNPLCHMKINITSKMYL